MTVEVCLNSVVVVVVVVVVMGFVLFCFVCCVVLNKIFIYFTGNIQRSQEVFKECLWSEFYCTVQVLHLICWSWHWIGCFYLLAYILCLFSFSIVDPETWSFSIYAILSLLPFCQKVWVKCNMLQFFFYYFIYYSGHEIPISNSKMILSHHLFPLPNCFISFLSF